MTKKNTETHWPTFDSMTGCASAMKIPLSAIRLAKRQGCGAFRQGRIYSVELIAFLFQHLTTSEELPAGFSSWADVWNCEKAKREKLKRLQDEGNVIAFDEARRQASVAAHAYFAELDRLCDECPPILSGLTPVQIHVKLCERREKIRNDLNEKFDAIGTPAK